MITAISIAFSALCGLIMTIIINRMILPRLQMMEYVAVGGGIAIMILALIFKFHKKK